MREKLNRMRKAGNPISESPAAETGTSSRYEGRIQPTNVASAGPANPAGQDSTSRIGPQADKLLIAALVLGPVSNVAATLRIEAEQAAELKRTEIARVEARAEAERADSYGAAVRTDSNRILNMAFIAPAVVAVVAGVTLMMPDAWKFSSAGFFLVGDDLVYDAASMAKGHLPAAIAVLCLLTVTCVICRRYWNRNPSELRYVVAGLGALMAFAIYPMVFLAVLLLANVLVYVAAGVAAIAIVIFMLNAMLD